MYSIWVGCWYSWCLRFSIGIQERDMSLWGAREPVQPSVVRRCMGLMRIFRPEPNNNVRFYTLSCIIFSTKHKTETQGIPHLYPRYHRNPWTSVLPLFLASPGHPSSFFNTSSVFHTRNECRIIRSCAYGGRLRDKAKIWFRSWGKRVREKDVKNNES